MYRNRWDTALFVETEHACSVYRSAIYCSQTSLDSEANSSVDRQSCLRHAFNEKTRHYIMALTFESKLTSRVPFIGSPFAIYALSDVFLVGSVDRQCTSKAGRNALYTGLPAGAPCLTQICAAVPGVCNVRLTTTHYRALPKSAPCRKQQRASFDVGSSHF